MRPHWSNCITHFDTDVDAFIADYFANPARRCLLVAGAGFDPRARLVAERLSPVLGERLQAIFLREDRLDSESKLASDANANEAALKSLAPNSAVLNIVIFAEDGAAVGGQRIIQALKSTTWPDVTDVVLDLSALSVGVGFPAARLLLAECEKRPDVNFHLMIGSNPELDARIVAEPSAQPGTVRGFAGAPVESAALPLARIWLPHLAPGKNATLAKIRAQSEGVYKVCPVLPFPARDPRRADALIAEYQTELRDDWAVDARDIIYVSERNPLDAYRTISTLKARYDRTVEEVYTPQLVLSPVGSKVMAAGALMAAIEHDLVVQHVEALRYELSGVSVENSPNEPDMIVHVWLHGPIYAGYSAA